MLQDPFVVVSKTTESGTTVPICKTEVLKNDHNPRWKPVFLSIQQAGSKVQEFSKCLIKFPEVACFTNILVERIFSKISVCICLICICYIFTHNTHRHTHVHAHSILVYMHSGTWMMEFDRLTYLMVVSPVHF